MKVKELIEVLDTLEKEKEISFINIDTEQGPEVIEIDKVIKYIELSKDIKSFCNHENEDSYIIIGE